MSLIDILQKKKKLKNLRFKTDSPALSTSFPHFNAGTSFKNKNRIVQLHSIMAVPH